MDIGILAVQGAFAEHRQMVEGLGHKAFEIRCKRDINKNMDGLILPGGESTAMGKLLTELELYEPLRAMISGGLPVYGTCAGMILLAKRILGQDTAYFGTMDITVKRNAYGRQLGSFVVTAPFAGVPVPMVFIRAPYIDSTGDGVQILAEVDGKIVAAKAGKTLVTSFHPELNRDAVVHEYFMNMILA